MKNEFYRNRIQVQTSVLLQYLQEFTSFFLIFFDIIRRKWVIVAETLTFLQFWNRPLMELHRKSSDLMDFLGKSTVLIDCCCFLCTVHIIIIDHFYFYRKSIRMNKTALLQNLKNLFFSIFFFRFHKGKSVIAIKIFLQGLWTFYLRKTILIYYDFPTLPVERDFSTKKRLIFSILKECVKIARVHICSTKKYSPYGTQKFSI